MKRILTGIMGLLVSTALAEGQLRCDEARTPCINSCATDECRAACERDHCKADEAQSPSSSATAAATESSETAEGFPDTDRNSIVCDHDLGEVMEDTLLPMYKEHGLVSVYDSVFSAWNCKLEPRPWTLQAGPQINPWAGNDQ